MRIEYLDVRSSSIFGNLSIDFDKSRPLTVILGKNGSGKSNLLEVITRIFMALEDGTSPGFDFEIKYACNGYIITIISSESSEFYAQVISAATGENQYLDAKSFKHRANELLPAFVFAYHSGRSERLENLFTQRDRKYFEKIRREERSVFGGLEGQWVSDRSSNKRFVYVKAAYSQLGLLALNLNTSEAAKKIREDLLRIGSLESILITLRKPENAKSRNSGPFWGVSEEFLPFLNRLEKAAWKPFRTRQSERIDSRDKTERAYFYLLGESLRDAFLNKGITITFAIGQLESLFANGILESIKLQLRHPDGMSIEDRQLSEGEQQLISILGMIAATGGNESLYLLDEPDSHLNPKWAYDYIGHLSQAFETTQPKGRFASDITQTSDFATYGMHQLLLATHNPLTIGPLESSQIRILNRTPKGISAEVPKYDPRGVGVDGLKMDIFGLTSTLDRNSWNMIKRHYYLAGKSQRTLSENEELIDLARKINNIPINLTHPNPYFEKFAQAMARRTPNLGPIETSEAIEEQADLIDDLLSEIMEGGS